MSLRVVGHVSDSNSLAIFCKMFSGCAQENGIKRERDLKLAEGGQKWRAVWISNPNS